MIEADYSCKSIVNPLKASLKKVLLQEGLIDKNATFPLLNSFSEEYIFSDVFLGTGISNPKELSIGLPFDFLLYPLLANKIRNDINSTGNIHHLIADNHALLNKFDARTVKKTASDYRKKVADIVDTLGIKNYHIYLSSEVATDKNYQSILTSASDSTFSNNYAKLEAVDVEYFHRTRDVLLKLGWKFSGKSSFDEQNFDIEYIKGFGNKILPIYTACGKRFNDKCPNAVPYTLFSDEIKYRFIIDKNEDVIKKVASQTCSTATINMLQNHYRAIVRLFDSIIKLPLALKTTWEKVQYINNLITY